MITNITSLQTHCLRQCQKRSKGLAKVRQAALWLLFLFFSINLQAQSTATLSVANHGIESDSPTDITGTVTLNQAASGDTTFNL
ncbi:MAG: hypothetical protein OIF50_14840, partial [Flavobacteriaceae bacterium]|nr:hypothetical protein [Flavobacteriaceae bacterium]